MWVVLFKVLNGEAPPQGLTLYSVFNAVWDPFFCLRDSQVFSSVSLWTHYCLFLDGSLLKPENGSPFRQSLRVCTIIQGTPGSTCKFLLLVSAFLVVHVLVGRICANSLFVVNTCRYGRGLVKNSALLLPT